MSTLQAKIKVREKEKEKEKEKDEENEKEKEKEKQQDIEKEKKKETITRRKHKRKKRREKEKAKEKPNENEKNKQVKRRGETEKEKEGQRKRGRDGERDGISDFSDLQPPRNSKKHGFGLVRARCEKLRSLMRAREGLMGCCGCLGASLFRKKPWFFFTRFSCFSHHRVLRPLGCRFGGLPKDSGSAARALKRRGRGTDLMATAGRGRWWER